jgi:uncharacterized glyoxalase superfamily protein PhnB
MHDEPPIRVGLRVPDVAAAAAVYEALGFTVFAIMQGGDGRPVMAVLRRGPLQLLADALTGLPFADTERERRTRAGPRGLGVVVGLAVDDVDAATARAAAAGCAVTYGPADAAWGERYAELEDPYGYAWKLYAT